ncbi:MAG: hypothetical protein SFU25_10960 [Candidatus Caenarcaniphilales bacterium]|nr:hypothetical protein [Candidatus Caenarcaniphilales bacterium]
MRIDSYYRNNKTFLQIAKTSKKCLRKSTKKRSFKSGSQNYSSVLNRCEQIRLNLERLKREFHQKHPKINERDFQSFINFASSEFSVALKHKKSLAEPKNEEIETKASLECEINMIEKLRQEMKEFFPGKDFYF